MSALISALKLVPKNALSRAVGVALRAPLPTPVTRTAIRGFSRIYGVDVDEAEQELGAYATFNDFFTRRLKPGVRPVAAGEEVCVSPVDGAVGELGTIEGGTLVQAKGRTYTVSDFLVDREDAAAFEGGTFLTIYLAPYNYHRIHSPVEGQVTGYAYVPGHLWPVNVAGVGKVDKLFAVNERLISYVRGRAGLVAVAKVGATCVGRIRALYDDVVTNDGGERSFRRVRYELPITLPKGGELGVFEMGSTVILLFEKGRLEVEGWVQPGAVVRMGQSLGRLRLD